MTARRVGSNMAQSLRFAPSIVQPIGIPTRSVINDHFHPDFARSVGFGLVPSPPKGALCWDPSTATSVRFSPTTGGYPPPLT